MVRRYSKQHVRKAMEGFTRWKVRKWDEVSTRISAIGPPRARFAAAQSRTTAHRAPSLQVQVIAGREKGKVGIVKEVIHDKVRPMVVLEGINLQRRPKPKVRGPFSTHPIIVSAHLHARGSHFVPGVPKTRFTRLNMRLPDSPAPPLLELRCARSPW